MEFSFKDPITTADEIFASQQLFEILKTLKDSYFNELHTYKSLDFLDEYDEVTDKEDSADEEESVDDYDENQYLDVENNFYIRRDGKYSGMG
ncbi:unnamed protein product [Rotaria sp. Silwood2]|nr:unnamed protein product [Rotaria sp. Silwood2]CAF2711245.1 unnamed protein product [Rotaria sp. Silwood2]CAF2984233.1 unnamed protein product [Rotaria sp. Silwood2]CAF3140461.1 unnamed protein product [Rotaria sp. Silwood2]CAF4438835.1 unnamed protein product [Rotaria sp. Silwood2]